MCVITHISPGVYESKTSKTRYNGKRNYDRYKRQFVHVACRKKMTKSDMKSVLKKGRKRQLYRGSTGVCGHVTQSPLREDALKGGNGEREEKREREGCIQEAVQHCRREGRRIWATIRQRPMLRLSFLVRLAPRLHIYSRFRNNNYLIPEATGEMRFRLAKREKERERESEKDREERETGSFPDHLVTASECRE